MAFQIDDSYVDVAARLREFYEKYPDGRITSAGDPWIMSVGGKDFIAYKALAYRTPDDPVPCAGTAWEPFPGPTQFTRDSELMNAETSAWGRAIVAAGIPSKKIASTEEVRNRQDSNGDAPVVHHASQTSGPNPKQKGKLKAELTKSGTKKKDQLEALIRDVGLTEVLPIDADWMDRLTSRTISVLIERVQQGALPEPSAPSDIPQDDGFQSEPLPIGTDPDGTPF